MQPGEKDRPQAVLFTEPVVAVALQGAEGHAERLLQRRLGLQLQRLCSRVAVRSKQDTQKGAAARALTGLRQNSGALEPAMNGSCSSLARSYIHSASVQL